MRTHVLMKAGGIGGLALSYHKSQQAASFHKAPSRSLPCECQHGVAVTKIDLTLRMLSRMFRVRNLLMVIYGCERIVILSPQNFKSVIPKTLKWKDMPKPLRWGGISKVCV